MSLIFSSIVQARNPVRSGREPLGEPTFEEEAGNGDVGTIVPSIAHTMRKDGKLQNWVVDTWTRQNQKSHVCVGDVVGKIGEVEENSSTMLIMLWLGNAPIDEILVEPCLMMAALIGWSVGRRPRVLRGMEKAPCMRTFQ